jgi:hypothetical protein
MTDDAVSRFAAAAQTARTSASRLIAYSSSQQTAASHAAEWFDASYVFTPLPECLPSHWRRFRGVPDIARANRTTPQAVVTLTPNPTRDGVTFTSPEILPEGDPRTTQTASSG